LYIYLVVRIIAISTLRSSWKNSAQLKTKYRNASIINSKRAVFNIKGNDYRIKGNDYRLIVDIEYRLKIV